MSMLDDVQAFAMAWETTAPRIARLMVHETTSRYLKIKLSPIESAPTWRPGPGLAPFGLGVPVVIDDGMEPGTWKAIDQDGNEMGSGSIVPDGHRLIGVSETGDLYCQREDAVWRWPGVDA